MKKELNPHIDELLVKSMLDEASVAEQIELNQWLSDSDDNQRYSEHFEMIWKHSRKLAVASQVDENAAWERFKERTRTRQEETKVLPLHPKRSKAFLRIAAAIVMTVCAGWLAYFVIHTQIHLDRIVIRSGSQTLVDTLPDGSVVVLNKRSSIAYPEDFDGDTRKVSLSGEAFFDVKPDKSKPFVITVNEVAVRVVGTSFNVKETKRDVEVIVETGLVEVAKAKRKVHVSPKEKVVVERSGGQFVKGSVDEEFYKYFRTNKLICNNTPLWRLVEILNETFEADIRIANEKLRDQPINTTFDQKSLDNILSVISATLDLQMEKTGNQIILK